MVQLYICSNSYIHTHTHRTSGVWSTHQGFLKGPIGQWMTYVDHVTQCVRCTAVTIYTGV